MKKWLKWTIVLTATIVILFSTIIIKDINDKEESKEIPSDLLASLNDCDESQKYINMPIIPECYLSLFSQYGFSSKEVEEYLNSKGYNLNELLKESDFWVDAWLKYYPDLDSLCYKKYSSDCRSWIINECKDNDEETYYMVSYDCTDLPSSYFYSNFSFAAECGGMPLPGGGYYQTSDICNQISSCKKVKTCIIRF
jgi:hypothetical protein